MEVIGPLEVRAATASWEHPCERTPVWAWRLPAPCAVLSAAEGVCSTGLSIDGVVTWDKQGAVDGGVQDTFGPPSGNSCRTDGATAWLPVTAHRVNTQWSKS